MPSKALLSPTEDTSIVLGVALGLTWLALVLIVAFACTFRHSTCFRRALIGFRNSIVNCWRRHVGVRHGAVFISFQGAPFEEEEPRKLRVAMTPALGAALRDAELLDGSVAADASEIEAATMATLELHYDKEPLKKASREASLDTASAEKPARKKLQKKHAIKKSRRQTEVAEVEGEEEVEEWAL